MDGIKEKMPNKTKAPSTSGELMSEILFMLARLLPALA